MKKILFLLIFLSSLVSSQIIKDTIFGRPKYIKEYVLFLNETGPFTLMSGDSEYGHSILMTPKNLRESMSHAWFDTYFCRYINNEAYYDENKNITKEKWYYKSGEIVGNYDYKYDPLNRKTIEKLKDEDSEITYRYFYDKNSTTVKFTEMYYKQSDKPMEKTIDNIEGNKPLFVTKFDSISKTDSHKSFLEESRKTVLYRE
jgi:hypothetical protein